MENSDRNSQKYTEGAEGTAGLILASGSPRRRELMQRLNRPFTVETSEVEETLPEHMTAGEAAGYLASLKASAVFQKHKDEERSFTVIGSDTVVILDGEIFGKPEDEAGASRMLHRLSGKTHEVRTGVSFFWKKAGKEGCTEGRETFISVTKVRFYPLSEKQIRDYIATGEPMDKAGAYGIQGFGSLLVEGIEGDYFTVVGFPIAEISRRLATLGL